MNRSYWQTQPLPRFPKASVRKPARNHFDVVVVGGGVTGLTAAYFLKQAGAKVCLLERDQLASGETGRTTAHLNVFIDLALTELMRSFGETDAGHALAANQAAIEAIAGIAQREGIACEFRRVPGYLHAPLLGSRVRNQGVNRFREEAELARRLGVPCSYEPDLPGVGLPGIRFENQALFHPLAFLAGLAPLVDGHGSAIFEDSDVTEVSDRPDGSLAASGDGFSFTCGFVVIATHVPIVGKNDRLSAALFQTKIAPYTTYVVAGKIPSDSLPQVSASDTSDPYYYWRVEPGKGHDLLILGGRDHKTGQVVRTRERFVQLEKAARRLVPDFEPTGRWSGQVVETHDGLPLIGEIADKQFVATGFTGNGITFGVASAMMARDCFLGVGGPWFDLFSPHRKPVKAGGLRSYFQENADYPRYMLKQRVAALRLRSPKSLKAGEGALLRVKGERVACCRDADGKLHQVSAICTHMGCLVEWNGAEQTWDCPCHGSRFTPDGKVIGGPAERPLQPIG